MGIKKCIIIYLKKARLTKMIDILKFQKNENNRGSLISLEEHMNIPFKIKRVYYIYDVPNNSRRGFHSHKKLKQVLICISGSIKIDLEYENNRKTILLDDPSKGLYIGANVWREMYNFTQGAVLMVIASELYNEDDYVRDYSLFKKKGIKL